MIKRFPVARFSYTSWLAPCLSFSKPAAFAALTNSFHFIVIAFV